MSALEEQARTFAEKAHGSQQYGDEPYVVHLAAVRAVLVEAGETNEHLLAAAWLHDVLEDCSLPSPVVLEEQFGSTVALHVWAVTGVGRNRRERNTSVYDKLVPRPHSITLKLADRLANARASKKSHSQLFTLYKREYTAFRAKLKPASPQTAPVTWMWRELDQIFLTT